MFTLVKTFWAMLLGKEGENARKAALVILALVLGMLLILGIALSRYLSPSELEKQIDSRAPVITENQSNINVSQPQIAQSTSEVEQSRKTTQKASKARETAIQTNAKNTNYSEANKQRCLTFPDSEECR